MVGGCDRRTGKWFCPCGRSFAHEPALRQHLGDSPSHWYCVECDRDFVSETSRQQHWDMSPRHVSSSVALPVGSLPQTTFFPLQEGQSSHGFIEQWEVEDDGLGYDYELDPCEQGNWWDEHNSDCDDEDRLSATNSDGVATRSGDEAEAIAWGPEVFSSSEVRSHDALESSVTECRYYCTPCRRTFPSEHDLRSHENSRAHRLKTVKCPLHSCTGAFESSSALVQHWESGACAGPVSRAQIDSYIIKYDVRNLVSVPRLRITGSHANATYIPPPTYLASDLAWNGCAFECYFCHSTFRTLVSLNQHLNSAVHNGPTDKIYRCPKGASCGRPFVTLSAVVQHVESGACGVKKFQGVQTAMDQLMRGVNSLRL